MVTTRDDHVDKEIVLVFFCRSYSFRPILPGVVPHPNSSSNTMHTELTIINGTAIEKGMELILKTTRT